uniref:Integrase zinc-binding domain-containing protein n=1 Tax=Tanacetum cinerariifolium TaxID=118510 RepID=A0A6L2JRU1_TANCI|nr:hypothetical protein [Tanacetum cinerariifolium]
MKADEERFKDSPVSKEEHEVHLKLILELLENEKRFIANFSKITKPLTLLTQKDKKFEWGDEHENSFQTLKDMLCDAPILPLLEGPYDFVVYYDTSNQGKKNVVADALSGKEWMKSRRVQVMSMMIHSSIKKGRRRTVFGEQILVHAFRNMRTLIMDEAHATKYSVYFGTDKMYYDLRDLYWLPGMKKNNAIDEFPLPEQLLTANEDKFPLLIQSDATVVKLALLLKSRNNFTVTTEDMQKRKNDVKAKTTLLLSILDEHQLRFSKYKTAQELWTAILKTFGGNDATKKTKKNLLKQQYENFKAEGTETLEQTFNRLQVIVNQLEFMDIEIEYDDLNQKFLTSLAPEWLMHTIVWRNRSDLDTVSLDDLYNQLKVYESEVQKKSESNSQNMVFISSTKHISGNKEVNTASVSTASTNVSPVSANIGAASISQDIACAYIASQSSGSQIKFEDINQIDEDDMEEMDIKWNMALLTMRADRFWKKTGKKLSI